MSIKLTELFGKLIYIFNNFFLNVQPKCPITVNNSYPYHFIAFWLIWSIG